MLCDRCKKRNALYHYKYKSTINGKTSEYHLCPEYAMEFGIAETQPFSLFSPGDEFQFAGFPFFTGAVPKRPRERRVCPVCGASAEEIANGGCAGCSECYNTFADMFGVIITKLHGRVSHAGRAPRGFDSAKYRQRTIEKEIDKLKEQLNGAVKAENYELAAKLRDKINELKAGGK